MAYGDRAGIDLTSDRCQTCLASRPATPQGSQGSRPADQAPGLRGKQPQNLPGLASKRPGSRTCASRRPGARAGEARSVIVPRPAGARALPAAGGRAGCGRRGGGSARRLRNSLPIPPRRGPRRRFLRSEGSPRLRAEKYRPEAGPGALRWAAGRSPPPRGSTLGPARRPGLHNGREPGGGGPGRRCVGARAAAPAPPAERPSPRRARARLAARCLPRARAPAAYPGEPGRGNFSGRAPRRLGRPSAERRARRRGLGSARCPRPAAAAAAAASPRGGGRRGGAASARPASRAGLGLGSGSGGRGQRPGRGGAACLLRPLSRPRRPRSAPSAAAPLPRAPGPPPPRPPPAHAARSGGPAAFRAPAASGARQAGAGRYRAGAPSAPGPAARAPGLSRRAPPERAAVETGLEPSRRAWEVTPRSPGWERGAGPRLPPPLPWAENSGMTGLSAPGRPPGGPHLRPQGRPPHRLPWARRLFASVWTRA